MNTIERGNKLEDAFYQYLLDQQRRGDLVYGVHTPTNCKIYKKKKYYCNERKANIEFDVVLELYGTGRTQPHSTVVFECKNYSGSIPETEITDFSDKIRRIFNHSVKGVLVVNSRLQSGAEMLAQSRSMGIVKYDEEGFEIVADRQGRVLVEDDFVGTQIFQKRTPSKSLKFSAYYDEKFYATAAQFLIGIFPEIFTANKFDYGPISPPYISEEDINCNAQDVLSKIDYSGGAVDLRAICSKLSIEMVFAHHGKNDSDRTPILGTANFARNLIYIYPHDDKNRERFTISHELGHFCLNHELFLRSETIIASDLISDKETEQNFNYDRLEAQANIFASKLLLPDEHFKIKTAEYRRILDIRDRGHGYIFVDDQPCNYMAYHQLLLNLSFCFEVSKHAIEIKFKNFGMLSDHRKRKETSLHSRIVDDAISRRL